MTVDVSLITGLNVGLEHISPEVSETTGGAILLDVLFVRICFFIGDDL